MTIKECKLTRLCYTRFIAGQPLTKVEGVRLNTQGLPSRLVSMNNLAVKGNSHLLRSLLTILNVTRPIRLPPVLDTKPIEDA